jgi:hypothetical protein
LHLQLARDLDTLLTEAASQLQHVAGFKNDIQRDDRVTQISMAIKASVKRKTLNELAREKGMLAVLTDLKRDNIKCQALLTSELNAENFVREILRTTLRPAKNPHQEPSSSSSNGVDDITQVGNSRSSQQFQPLSTSTLTQPTAEVEKIQRSADLVNCSSLSSSTLPPQSTVNKAQNSDYLSQTSCTPISRAMASVIMVAERD